jgi:uncharacterized glyoxalase superfamily protein PhnB
MTASLCVSLTYADAPAAIEFLTRAFGFRLRLEVPGVAGKVQHSELSLGTAVVFVSSPKPEQGREAPSGGVPCSVCVAIEDPDAHHARAIAAGAEIVHALKDEDYGSRGYMVRDPGGHLWYFGTYKPGRYWDGGA